MEINIEKHEVIDSVNLSLTVDEARHLAGLLAAVPVGTTTDTFDNIANSIAWHLDIPHYAVNKETGEYSQAEGPGCGCGFSDETDAV